MKFRAVLTLLAVSAQLAGPTVHAAGPDDLYLDAYRLIQEGDQFVGAGQAELARQRYFDAEANLKKIQGSYPEYNKNAVEFRLEYLRDRVKTLPASKGGVAPASSQPAKPAARTPAEQINELSGRIAQLEADNSMLQSKLKEALAPQPAALDPHEFARAQERINQLEKEKELLRASLSQAQAKQPQAADNALLEQARGELEATKKTLVENIASLATLTQDNQRLQQQLASAQQAQAKSSDAALLEQMRGQLETTRKQLADNSAALATLTQDNQRLQQQLASAQQNAGQAQALKDAQTKLAAIDQERADWQKQRSDLESRLAAASKVSPEVSNARELEKERDSLQKKLNDANRDLTELRSSSQNIDRAAQATQLANLRARLEVFEARKVPYTKEELALMDKNVPKIATSVETKPAKRAARELPPGASIVVAEAERAFAAKRYQDAEAKYIQVLKMDEENPVSLANLAAIQMEMQKLDEANGHLTKALAANPEDAYALSLMGMLRFQQGKYDEALDNLSRSAQLDPKNPETQNYLGITLSQQGQREAAETALRKAVTLNPNYAGAHHNLAVIYATQRPPFLELAKYHYNKALALGQPASADLEKQLSGK